MATFAEVADAGFAHVDLTDSWVRPGDLSEARLDDLRAAASEAGVEPAAISAIRRSVIDAANADANLAYSHRTVDAAARLGVGVVSFGLHQDLTPAQRRQLWFWTVEGHKDPVGDAEVWAAAVSRFRDPVSYTHLQAGVGPVVGGHILQVPGQAVEAQGTLRTGVADPDAPVVRVPPPLGRAGDQRIHGSPFGRP